MNLQEFKEFLEYDPITGVFIWKKSPTLADKKGSVAGHRTRRGYVTIVFKGKQHKAHRLAWLFSTGEMPKQEIDHVNGIHWDNRIVNLRDVSPRLNQQNRPSHRAGRLPGTYKHVSGLWGSRINHNGKIVSLKYHQTEQEAHEAYLRYARENGITLLKEVS